MASHSHTTPERSRPEGPIARAIGAVSTACGVVSAVMIFASVLITCQMIWMRFVMNASTIWQTEAVIYLMISATLIGLPYVQRVKGHVNVDLIPLMLPPIARKILAVLTLIMTIVIIGVMAFHAYELFHMAFKRNWKSDTVWGVPMWIPYIAMPIGFGLFLLQLIGDLVDTLTQPDSPYDYGEATDPQGD